VPYHTSFHCLLGVLKVRLSANTASATAEIDDNLQDHRVVVLCCWSLQSERGKWTDMELQKYKRDSFGALLIIAAVVFIFY
jgi:GH43 family beta-xylosidase